MEKNMGVGRKSRKYIVWL